MSVIMVNFIKNDIVLDSCALNPDELKVISGLKYVTKDDEIYDIDIIKYNLDNHFIEFHLK